MKLMIKITSVITLSNTS